MADITNQFFFVSQAQLKKMLILKPQFGVPHLPQFSGIKGFSPQNKTTTC